MKTSLVTPLLKKSNLDRNNLKNYRPVSNLSFLSKILEKVVAKQLKDYMDAYGLHETSQSAYKAFHSTETAILKIQDDILNAVDKNEIVVLILLDLSAAFDLIDHDILFERMKSILGITGTVRDWFKSYLNGRSQRIKIGNIKSAIHWLLYGVPQGSVLGPILFLIFILPLAELIRRHGLNPHGYADDTQVYLSFKPDLESSVHNIVKKIESCLSDIFKWMTKNKLKVNPDKTEVLIIGTSKQRAKFNIPSLKVGDCEIKITNVPVKNLGVIFNDSLSSKDQINYIVRSANYHLRAISRIREYLTDDVAKKCVVSLVLSRLDYCNSFLVGSPSSDLNKMQLVQNYAAKLIYKMRKYDHVTPLLKSLHWLPIKKRIDFKILLTVYKCLNGLAPIYLSELIIKYQPTRNLRSKDNCQLVVPHTRLVTFGDRSFRRYGPYIWNKLPLHIRLSDSVELFKTKLKTYLFAN